MVEASLFDLFLENQNATFNIVFYNFHGKQTMNFNQLNDCIKDIVEILKAEIVVHSVIACLIRPGLALPAIVLGVSKISSPFVFLDVHDPVTSLKNLQKYVPIKYLLIEETFLKNCKGELCTCWSTKATIVSSSISPLVLLKSSDCSIETCLASKVYPSFSGYVPKLSYIIQTSGTTGEPKIVQVPHQCILPNIIDLRKRFNITSEDVLLMCSPLTFDPSIVEMFLAIVSGCTLVIVPDQLKSIPKRLCDIIVDSNTTIIQATPSLIKSFNDRFIKDVLLSRDSKLRVLAFGGEICPSLKKLKKWKSQENQTQLFNLYGVTEVSCWASCNQLHLHNEMSDVILGDPLLETNIVLSDDGEILIGGDKRWCIVDDEMWPDDESQFMRKTGDFASKTTYGLHFLGRMDSIIKYKGQKLSLEKICNIVEDIPEIINHYVHFDHRHPKIVLFVVQEVKNDINPEWKQGIIEMLRKLVPNLPVIEIIAVPYIPLTKHGKADCRKILEFSKSREHKCEDFIDANHANVISHLWKNYTKHSTISENDNFILSGGDSFSAVQCASDIEWKLQINAPELIEKLLNDSFKDVVQHVGQYLTTAKTSKQVQRSLFLLDDKSSYEPVCKKVHLEDLQCYKMATRRGCSVSCMHSEQETCCRNEMELQKNAKISLKMIYKFDLKKCVDASPCMAYFFESQKLLTFIGSHSGLFCCINVVDKHFEWTTNLPDRIESSSYITPCGKYVLLGCYDCHLYCIEIKMGTIKWKLKTDGEIKSSPVISSQNVAYFGSRDKYLYAVNADNGELVWKQLISEGSIFSSPALCNEKKCIAISTLDGVLAVLKMDTGNILWAFNYGKPLFSSPVFTSISIYVGSTNNCLLKFDLSGKLVSEHLTNGPVFSSPAIDLSQDLEQVVFGCHDGNVYCVGPKNDCLWKFCCECPVYATPFIFQWMQNKYVAVASTAGVIYILNHSSGAVVCLWKCPGEIFSSPVVLNNFLLVGCRDNNVYSFSLFDVI